MGVVAFLWPFWSPVAQGAADATAHSQDAPLVTALVVGLCVLVAVADRADAQPKSVALLGVLCAINAALRLVSNFLPMRAGSRSYSC
jgi:hypothetical protein